MPIRSAGRCCCPGIPSAPNGGAVPSQRRASSMRSSCPFPLLRWPRSLCRRTPSAVLHQPLLAAQRMKVRVSCSVFQLRVRLAGAFFIRGGTLLVFLPDAPCLCRDRRKDESVLVACKTDGGARSCWYRAGSVALRGRVSLICNQRDLDADADSRGRPPGGALDLLRASASVGTYGWWILSWPDRPP